jgi:hypothetical protein
MASTATKSSTNQGTLNGIVCEDVEQFPVDIGPYRHGYRLVVRQADGGYERFYVCIIIGENADTIAKSINKGDAVNVTFHTKVRGRDVEVIVDGVEPIEEISKFTNAIELSGDRGESNTYEPKRKGGKALHVMSLAQTHDGVDLRFGIKAFGGKNPFADTANGDSVKVIGRLDTRGDATGVQMGVIAYRVVPVSAQETPAPAEEATEQVAAA